MLIYKLFDLTLKEESTDLAQLIDTIKSLPEYKQNKVISAINTIIIRQNEKEWKRISIINLTFPTSFCV